MSRFLIDPDPREVRRAIADVERSSTAAGRRVTGCLAIEGLRLHERAVRAGHRPNRVLAAGRLLDRPDPRERAVLEALAAAGTIILRAPDEEVERLMDGRGGGALVGLVPIPETVDACVMMAKADLAGRPALLLAGVDDPGNLGALARTALGAGAALLFVTRPGDPFHPKAVRTSMGAIFKLPIAIGPEPAKAVDDLRRAGVRVVGAVSHGGTPLPHADLDGPLAIALGSEAFGLESDVVDRLDDRVTIPMASDVDSFSVNAAAAALLYEVARRRTE